MSCIATVHVLCLPLTCPSPWSAQRKILVNAHNYCGSGSTFPFPHILNSHAVRRNDARKESEILTRETKEREKWCISGRCIHCCIESYFKIWWQHHSVLIFLRRNSFLQMFVYLQGPGNYRPTA